MPNQRRSPRRVTPCLYAVFGLAAIAPATGCSTDEEPPVATAVASQQLGAVVTSQPVGTLPGELSVAPDGSASYTMPLWLPQGRAGIQPTLSLGYSSRGRDGLLGVGWSLSGLSAIEPCNRTWAIDGTRSGAVTLDGNDAYCLDGVRLVTTGGTVPGELGEASCTEYRTIPDSFARVAQCSTAWYVRAKDGHILHYGTGTGRIQAPGQGPIAWLLERMADRNGNAMTVSYKTSGGTPGPLPCGGGTCLQFRPDHIDYTVGTGQSATRSVQFEYDTTARPDKTRRYLRATAIDANDRIKRIRAIAEGVTVRTYDFTYANSPTSGRTRLAQVKTCDREAELGGVCLPPTVLTYTTDVPDIHAWSGSGDVTGTLPGYSPTDPLYFTDVDGDGRDDLVYWVASPAPAWMVRLSTGLGFGPAQIQPTLQPANGGPPVGSLVYDVNGDGMTDLLTTGCECPAGQTSCAAPSNCQRPRVYLWDHTAGHFVLASYPGLPTTWESSVSVVDALGDGVPSYVERVGGASPYWQVLDNVFSSNPVVGYTFFDPNRNFFRDLDGDGKLEFLKFIPNGTNSLLDAITIDRLKAPGPAVTPRNIISGPVAQDLMNSPCLVWADFTGDRLVDALDPRTGKLYVNPGQPVSASFNGFVTRPWFPAPSTMPACGGLDAGYRVADFNGDGLQDLLVLGKLGDPGGPVEQARVFITRADGSAADLFTFPVVLVNPDQPLPPPPLPDDPPPQQPPPWVGSKNTRLVDVNGDGHFDIFQMTGQQSFVLTFQNALPVDLLVSVKNGIGRADSVSYATLADLPAGQFTRCYTPGCFNGPFTVVNQHKLDDGNGGIASFKHSYRDARMDRGGQGFLGFGTHEVTDLRTNAVVRTTYDNTTLVVGAPAGTTWYARLGTPMEVLSYVQDGTIWHASRTKITSFITPLTSNATSYFGYPLVTDQRVYEGTAFAATDPSTPSPYFDCGASVARCPGLTSSSTAVTFSDLVGNTTMTNTTRYVMTAGSTASFFDKVELAYAAPANDVASWLIGRPTLRTTTSTATGFADESPRTISYSYDAKGNLSQIEREPGALNGASATCSATSADPLYQRIKLGRDASTGVLTQVLVAPTQNDSDPRVRTTTLGYDPHFLFPISTTKATGGGLVPQLVTSSTVDPALGVQLRAVDENGAASDFDYDHFGRPRATRSAGGGATATSYQAAAAPYAVVVTTTGNDGSSSATYLDRLERPVRTARKAFDGQSALVDTAYDLLGRVAHVTRPYLAGTTPVPYAARYEYDALGRVRRLHQHDDSSSPPSGTPAIQTAYSGLVTTSADESGVQTVSIDDGAGHTIETRTFPDFAVAVTQFSIGPFGSLRRVTDAAGNVVTMAYDRVGRRTDLTDPDLGHVRSAYSELDDVIATTDAMAQTTCVTPDNLGRPLTRTAPDGTDHWVWDTAPGGKGRLATSTRTPLAPALPVSTSYAYDAHGVTGEHWTIDGAGYDYNYGYDAQGRLSLTSYPDAPGRPRFAVAQSYNASGYRAQLRDVSNPVAPVVLWTATAADVEGHLTQELLGNGLVTTSAYVADGGQLKHRGIAGIYDMTYTYDLNGNLHSRTNAGFLGNPTDTETFIYNGANQLHGTSLKNGGTVVTSNTYTYDVIGNLKSASDFPTCTSFVYGGPGAGPHQLTQATCYGTPYTHTYDKNGNELETTALDYREQTWTSFHKLDQMRSRDGRIAYSYDANHDRIKKERVPGIISWMSGTAPASPVNDGLSGVWDTTEYPGKQYERRAGTGLATIDHVYYVSAGSRRIAQLTWHQVPNVAAGAAEWSYYHLDYQGTVERTSDASGTVREYSASTAWGQRRHADWEYLGGISFGQNTRVGFTGHAYDDEFGTIDMGGRIYDPFFKRFLGPDPVVQAPMYGPSWNRYSYVWNNPLRRTDPSGFVGECTPGDTGCIPSGPGINPFGWFGVIADHAGDAFNAVGSVLESIGDGLKCAFSLGFACGGGGRASSAPGLPSSPGPGTDGRASENITRVNPVTVPTGAKPIWAAAAPATAAPAPASGAPLPATPRSVWGGSGLPVGHFPSGYYYVTSNPVGRTADGVTPESAMAALQARPNGIFPFDVTPVDGGDASIRLNGQYNLDNVRIHFDNGNGVIVIEKTPTSFTFFTLASHFDGFGGTIRFTTGRDADGNVFLQQEGNAPHAGLINATFAPIFAPTYSWPDQAILLHWRLYPDEANSDPTPYQNGLP